LSSVQLSTKSVTATSSVDLNVASVPLSDVAVTDFVDSCTDDNDSEEDLWYHIVVDGYYDLTTPGTYNVEYYVFDNDGNVSARVPFTFHVE
jgi:hypothetical protein